MKNIRLASLVFFLASCGYNKRATELLTNKTLVYSYITDGKESHKVYEMREKRGDTVFRCFTGWHNKWGLEDAYKAANEQTKPVSYYMRDNTIIRFNDPYVLKKKGNRLILSNKTIDFRTGKEYFFNSLQYRLDKTDTSFCRETGGLCGYFGRDYSQYIKDTVISVEHKYKIKCWVFMEFYPALRPSLHGSRDRTVTRYIDKATFLPIKIDTRFYDSTGFRNESLGRENYLVVTKILPMDSLRKHFTIKSEYCTY